MALAHQKNAGRAKSADMPTTLAQIMTAQGLAGYMRKYSHIRVAPDFDKIMKALKANPNINGVRFLMQRVEELRAGAAMKLNPGSRGMLPSAYSSARAPTFVRSVRNIAMARGLPGAIDLNSNPMRVDAYAVASIGRGQTLNLGAMRPGDAMLFMLNRNNGSASVVRFPQLRDLSGALKVAREQEFLRLKGGIFRLVRDDNGRYKSLDAMGRSIKDHIDSITSPYAYEIGAVMGEHARCGDLLRLQSFSSALLYANADDGREPSTLNPVLDSARMLGLNIKRPRKVASMESNPALAGILFDNGAGLKPNADVRALELSGASVDESQPVSGEADALDEPHAVFVANIFVPAGMALFR